MGFSLRTMLLSKLLLLCGYCTAANAAPAVVTVAVPRLTLEFALRAGHAALDFCQAHGYEVAVTVVDRAGNPLVVLRNTLARNLALEISRKKAYTAMTFARPTSGLASTAVAKALRFEPSLLFAGGGVPIQALGTVVGGIGVSGASTAQMDENCASQGISAIRLDLEMRDE
jgi:uncharacterized protein GlcG (DUF336 family)